jgi:Bacterial dnaA protein helix-turn-helix
MDTPARAGGNPLLPSELDYRRRLLAATAYQPKSSRREPPVALLARAAGLVSPPIRGNRPSVIVRNICLRHGVTEAQVRSKSRERWITLARHEAAYRLRVELGLSLAKIGRILGGRDRSTILEAIRKFSGVSS